MEWFKLKIKGIIFFFRFGYVGVLVGDKWYIVGGEICDFGEFIGIMILIFLNYFFGVVFLFIFLWIMFVII